MIKTLRWLFVCVFLVRCTGDDVSTPPPIDESVLSSEDNLPTVLGVTRLVRGCGDELASNYTEGVTPENDDCSCTYDDFEKPGVENTRTFVYRNILVESYSSTGARAGPVLDTLIDLADEGFNELSASYGLGSVRIVRISTHPEGEEAGFYPIERYEAFKQKFPNMEQRLSSGSEETDFVLPYYSVDNDFADRGTYYFDPTVIFKVIAGRFSLIPYAYISLQTVYKEEEGVVEGLVAFRFRVPDDGRTADRSYEIMLVEDGVVAAQANGAQGFEGIRNTYPHLYAQPATIQNYEHTNLVREKIADGVIRSFVALQGGGVYTRKFRYFIPRVNSRTRKAYNFENLHIVVLVIDSEESTALNVEMIPLGGSVRW